MKSLLMNEFLLSSSSLLARLVRPVFALLAAAISFTLPAHAQWELVKIADGDTPIPGVQNHTFDVFSAPVISGETVAFYGRSGEFHTPNQVGIFVAENGSIRIVADAFTPIPSGSGADFTRFAPPSLSAGKSAFWGQNHTFPLNEGIYTDEGGVLRMVADVDTPIPGGTGTFTYGFSGDSAIDSGNVAFINFGLGSGVYSEIGGDLALVANLSTEIPGGEGTFTPPEGGYAFEEVTLSGSSVAFIGRGDGQEGIYSTVGGALRVEADANTVLPGGNVTAGILRGPSLDREDVAFYAMGPNFLEGIYKKVGGTLLLVADTNMTIPQRELPFFHFDVHPALDNGNVVFYGSATPLVSYAGIFVQYGGVLLKVIDTDDTLDGKDIQFLTVGPRALSGSRIAFGVAFADFSQGVFVAESTLLFQDGFESGDFAAWSAMVQ